MSPIRLLALAALVPLVAAACGDGDTADTAATTPVADSTSEGGTPTTISSTATTLSPAEPAAGSTFVADVWADNWFALYVNGELIGEDSVPITTERSFNAETFTFDATYPLTIAIEAKDFKENDSGLEYIGQPNQQMGDGGLIAQITDSATGEIVAATDGAWSTLVIHRAPLNTDCESAADPAGTCQSESTDAPDGWTMPDFDDADWTSATVWSAAEVSPKDGYDQITWNVAAQLIWGTDLEVDNTVLVRATAG
jgi:hypothetical protein